jgi:2-dehydro-3-deoxy-D-arabinonate dehydratase
MKIYRTKDGIIVDDQSKYFLIANTDWDQFVNRKNLFKLVKLEIEKLVADGKLAAVISARALAPIGGQEVWASGVTYLRSREARMEESKDAGGGDFYARVYEAERPELFFKSPSYRVVGSGDAVRIRKDSKWNVPEPELTLFICSAGTIEGYTIGNDMSSRDIEGENPLYLPQAKSYNGATSIGPCLYVPESPIHPDSMISIQIQRNQEKVFEGSISINRMKRTHTELAEFLFREITFPVGTYLMTGTGVVPPDHFTLQSGDVITISIEHIGTLVNTVA